MLTSLLSSLDRDQRLRVVRLWFTACAGYALRMIFDPKGAVLQMAARKELFEDDNDERVKFAREAIRWAGVLVFAICMNGLVLAQVWSEGAIEVLRTTGWSLLIDAIVVKFYGYFRTGAFNHFKAIGGGTMSLLSGVYLIGGLD